jgi:hypothetical protein
MRKTTKNLIDKGLPSVLADNPTSCLSNQMPGSSGYTKLLALIWDYSSAMEIGIY